MRKICHFLTTKRQASLAGLILNSQANHPTADRPVIDLDMALLLAPMEMAGAILGQIIQKMLPDWAVS
jgi:hypothetical protein